MAKTEQTQRISQNYDQSDYLALWIEAFLIDRKASGLAAGSIRFYNQKLHLFSAFCDSQAVTQIHQVDSNLVRRFLLWLEETGHNPGGVHGCYRAARAFLKWWKNEVDPPGWKNPIERVKAPRLPQETIEGVSLETVRAMVEACAGPGFTEIRDRAIFLALLDTGARANEFRAMDIIDLDQITGAILIRQGKGRKPRTVFIQKKARQAVRAYLKARLGRSPALWVTDEGERITYDGLRAILARRAKLASVEAPSLHDFRRAFALTCLRNGMDVFTLQLLMGHTSLNVLRRYLAQNEGDLREAHAKAGPVERGLG